MTRSHRTTIAAAAFAVALPAAAAAETDLGFGTIRGYAELAYVFNDDFNENFFNADLSFSTGEGAFGPAPGLGFDAAIRAYSQDDINLHAVYGAVTYTTSFGKFSAGVPRPVMTDMVRFPAIGGARPLDIESTAFTQSIAETVYLLQEIDPPLGLRYDGRFGDLSVGLSWHHFDESGTEADVYDLGLRYDIGSWSVFAVAEHIDVSGSVSDTDYVVGVEGDFTGGSAPIRAGLALFDRDLFFGADAQGARGYVTYMPTDRLALNGTMFTVEGDAIYGIDMRYTFFQGAYVGLGVVDGDDLDQFYQVALGWEF
jgi:hypothetical protein